LSVDGQEVAKNTLDHTTPITFPEDESFDVALDTRTGVVMVEYRYDVPFTVRGSEARAVSSHYHLAHDSSKGSVK
jgi:hypothetical protein